VLDCWSIKSEIKMINDLHEWIPFYIYLIHKKKRHFIQKSDESSGLQIHRCPIKYSLFLSLSILALNVDLQFFSILLDISVIQSAVTSKRRYWWYLSYSTRWVHLDGVCNIQAGAQVKMFSSSNFSQAKKRHFIQQKWW
jgi:hypothetical protein